MSVTYLAAGGEGGLAGAVADFATKIMDVLGSPGAGLANALDSIIPVLPSEVILPLAGFAASRGTINLYAALVWTTIGSVVGSVVMYYIGAAFGRDRVMAWAAKIPLVKVSEIERTEAWFRRHGTKTVFFGRMLPVFRSLISIPAGLERMPLGRFVLFTALGSAIWNTLFVLAGYLLGSNWEKVEKYGSIFSKAVLALIVLAIAYFVVSRLLRRRRERAAGPDTPPQPSPGDPASARPATDRLSWYPPAPQPPTRHPASPQRRYAGTVYGTPRNPDGTPTAPRPGGTPPADAGGTARHRTPPEAAPDHHPPRSPQPPYRGSSADHTPCGGSVDHPGPEYSGEHHGRG